MSAEAYTLLPLGWTMITSHGTPDRTGDWQLLPLMGTMITRPVRLVRIDT